MADSLNPVATFTNNLGYDVDIYDTFSSSTGPQGVLTYTKLATITNNTTSQVQTTRIASQLQAMRTAAISALNGNYYKQFPVAVMGVTAFNVSNSFTLTSAMQQGMEQSFKFIKYVQANPSSQLATGFTTALGDPTSQSDAVNAFFLGTGSFQLCTIDTWTAVMTWQAQFTSAWQGTYYLYTLGSSGSSTTTASSPALLATLTIVSSAQADSAVLTMAGSNGQNTGIAMVGDGTMQEANAGTGPLSVKLTPSWMNITQFSLQGITPTTTYVISPAFTGSINGMQVTGNVNQLNLGSGSSVNAADAVKAAGSYLSTLATAVGMLTGIGMLYYMAKGHKQAEVQHKNDVQKGATSKTDAAQKVAQVEKDYQSTDVPAVRAQASQVETTTVPKVQAAYDQVDQGIDIMNKVSVVEQQEVELGKSVQTKAPSATTEKTGESLAQAQAQLEQAIDPKTSAATRAADLTTVTSELTATSTALQKDLAQTDRTRSAMETTALKDTQVALNSEQAQADSVKNNEQQQEQRDQESAKDPVNDSEFGNTDKPVEGFHK